MRRNYNILAHATLGVTKGKKLGVVGLGGQGHMAVKFAHALGAHVVVFTTSPRRGRRGLSVGVMSLVAHGAQDVYLPGNNPLSEEVPGLGGNNTRNK